MVQEWLIKRWTRTFLLSIAAVIRTHRLTANGWKDAGVRLRESLSILELQSREGSQANS